MKQNWILLKEMFRHSILIAWCFGYAGAGMAWSIYRMIHPAYPFNWALPMVLSLWMFWLGMKAAWLKKDPFSKQHQQLIEVVSHYNLLTLRFHLEQGEQTLKDEERYEELAELHELQNRVQEAIKNFNTHETDQSI